MVCDWHDVQKHVRSRVQRRTKRKAFLVSYTETCRALTVEKYHRISDETLDHLCEYLEALGDEIELDGFDIEYAVKYPPL